MKISKISVFPLKSNNQLRNLTGSIDIMNRKFLDVASLKSLMEEELDDVEGFYSSLSYTCQ